MTSLEQKFTNVLVAFGVVLDDNDMKLCSQALESVARKHLGNPIGNSNIGISNIVGQEPTFKVPRPKMIFNNPKDRIERYEEPKIDIPSTPSTSPTPFVLPQDHPAFGGSYGPQYGITIMETGVSFKTPDELRNERYRL